MAQYGTSFTYNGTTSSSFDLIISGFQAMDIPLGVKKSTTTGSINKYRTQVNLYGVTYDSVLTFNIQLMKNPCHINNQNDMKFSRAEIREILAWLTSPNTPRLFHMTDYEDSTDEEYDYFGVFTDVQTLDNNIYVLECTFETNSPFAYSIEQTATISNGSGIILNPSDEYEGYVYPIIKITPSESGSHSITITNQSDDNKSITLNNMRRSDDVTMDCQKMTIKNKSGAFLSFDDLEIDEFDYIYWPRLKYGENQISVSNSATLEFKYRYPVKVGGY